MSMSRRWPVALVNDVLVATDDERIKQAVERFGGRVVMVDGVYRTGTDRVAGVASMFAGDCFVEPSRRRDSCCIPI